MKSFRKNSARLALISLLIVFGIGVAQAELVEIPLPELLGEYPLEGFPPTSAFFSFNMDPNNINSVWIRISGIHSPGVLYCYGSIPPELEWSMYFSFEARDMEFNEWWLASTQEGLEAGEFSQLFELEPRNSSYSTTWNMLGDGVGEIEMMAFPDPNVCTPIDFPSATINEAVIIFDMESTVSMEQARWGSLKARYRN